MRIDRELDKVFRVTISEKEAELICDISQISFERHKLIVTRIGNSLLMFMQKASVAPSECQPPFKIEL